MVERLSEGHPNVAYQLSKSRPYVTRKSSTRHPEVVHSLSTRGPQVLPTSYNNVEELSKRHPKVVQQLPKSIAGTIRSREPHVPEYETTNRFRDQNLKQRSVLPRVGQERPQSATLYFQSSTSSAVVLVPCSISTKAGRPLQLSSLYPFANL